LEYNRLLKRQIIKYLAADIENDERFLALLDAVSDSYDAFERDKRLSEHAFEVSEKDYLDIYSRLKNEINIRNQSIQKLKETIRNMEPGAENQILQDGDNLLDVVNYLNLQVNKRKEAELAMRVAKEEAEKANQTKSEFLSVMSHEIRTPLNAVLGLGQLLLRQNPRPDQVNNMQVLKASAENLLALINDILEFSKINAKKLEIDHVPFNIRKTIEDVFQAISIRGTEWNNTMSIDIDNRVPHYIYGDPHRLTQVLNNLLSNAVKFTRDGRVEIKLTLENINSSRCSILFSITDSGIGIEREKLEHIFSPFAQASSSITRKFGGTGLGLAITAELLELMDCKINIETELGKGSRFYFTMQTEYLNDGNAQQVKSETKEQNLQHSQVLLVEDTPFNILFTKQLLEGWNTVVDVAENGLIAVEMIQQKQYDIILMDLHMPVMDGYTASMKIRAFNDHIPIIALTATVSADIKNRLHQVGMQDYIIKPFDIDFLFSKMQRVMKKVY
jgi:signal transduction histidine kinase/ActR/RegA family two-component response regulator